MFVRSTRTNEEREACPCGCVSDAALSNASLTPLAHAARSPQITTDLTASERQRETFAAGAVEHRTTDEHSEGQERRASGKRGRGEEGSIATSRPSRLEQCNSAPPHTGPASEVLMASWLTCPRPPRSSKLPILGLICLVVQVVTSGENPRKCGRSSNRPDLATKHNPWSLRWLVGRALSPRRIAGPIGRGLFQAAYSKSVSSRRYKTTPLRLSVNPSGRRADVSFPSAAGVWAAECIIYSLSLLF
jgi:hypothetical protein